MVKRLSPYEITELLVCGRLLIEVLENKYAPSLEEKIRLLNFFKLTDRLNKELKGELK